MLSQAVNRRMDENAEPILRTLHVDTNDVARQIFSDIKPLTN
jgi:hypothetical protein